MEVMSRAHAGKIILLLKIDIVPSMKSKLANVMVDPCGEKSHDSQASHLHFDSESKSLLCCPHTTCG